MAGIYNASAQAKYNEKPENWNNPIPANTTGKVNNSALPDVSRFLQAGIDPKTGMPYKAGDVDKGFKPHNKKLLRIMDEQAAINSVQWYNLPNGLNGNLIERILYYKGQGMFFYMETDNQFYFLPYALDGTIDVYGRYVDVTPLPFNGTANDGDKVKPWITGLRRRCAYDIKLDEITMDDITSKCVLLHDYSQQMAQTNISRQIANDPLIDFEADMLPFCRTALLNSTGVLGMRVNSQDEQSNVEAASRSINRAALEGKKYIPVIGNVDFQEMTGDKIGNADAFLMAMQSVDNFRLSTHGVDSGGIFQKQAHLLESENQMNASKSSFIMQDRISQRQRFCDIVNSIWGLGIWCDVSEPAIGVDVDMDGSMYENDPDTVSHSGGTDSMEDSDV